MKDRNSNRPWFAAGAVAWLAAIALATASPAWAADVTDPWLTTKVKMSLLTASDVDGLQINVDTHDGRVTLHGKASSAAEKSRAEQLARQVDGVREVRNLIQVVPGTASAQVAKMDDEIESAVKNALAAEPTLADSSISVQSVNNGTVLLAGKADTLSAHLRAIEVARGVAGVRRVESQVQSPERLADAEIWRETPSTTDVAAAGVRQATTDLWITTAAKVRLLAAEVPALDVNVDTRDGIVTLFGIVGTEQEKQTAAVEARKVDGVKQVRNELQVVPESRQKMVDKQDDQIQAAIEQKFETRTDLDDSDIDVEVRNGVVHLKGTVASQNDRLAALTSARSSDGVKSVVGDLRVQQN